MSVSAIQPTSPCAEIMHIDRDVWLEMVEEGFDGTRLWVSDRDVISVGVEIIWEEALVVERAVRIVTREYTNIELLQQEGSTS